MKPLAHPQIDDVTVEGILHAFSHPVRIQIYAALAAAEYPQCCSAYLNIKGAKLPKSTLSQHFTVLREAGSSAAKGAAMNCITKPDAKNLKINSAP